MVCSRVTLGLILVTACGRAGGDAPATVPAPTESTRLDVKPIGSSCLPSDGYVPDHTRDCTQGPGVDGGCSTDATPTVETWHLSPGVGYCLLSFAFPNGYFTMNCPAGDGDCPGGSTCLPDHSYCVAPCQSDNECVAPSTCAGFAPASCICVNCPDPSEKGAIPNGP